MPATSRGTKKLIDLRMSAVKPLGASWIVSACSYVKNNPEIIMNGFKESGIVCFLHLVAIVHMYVNRLV